MANKIDLNPIETAYLAYRIMVDSRGFSGSDVKNDKHSRPDLLGIIENAISDINAVRKWSSNFLGNDKDYSNPPSDFSYTFAMGV